MEVEFFLGVFIPDPFLVSFEFLGGYSVFLNFGLMVRMGFRLLICSSLISAFSLPRSIDFFYN